MRATVMFSAGDVRIETVPDARVVEAVGADVRTMKVGDVVVMPLPVGRITSKAARERARTQVGLSYLILAEKNASNSSRSCNDGFNYYKRGHGQNF